MKLVIAMPTYKVMDTKCVHSLIGFYSDLINDGHQVVFIFANNFYITYARNSLLNSAGSVKDADYILCLDSDHIYESKKFYKLLKDLEDNKLDLLSAKYYLRGSLDNRGKIAALKKIDGELQQLSGDDYISGIHECDAVGFGFLLLRASFVRTLIDKKIKLFQVTDVGEDVYFCDVIKQLGYKVCFDADVVIGHLSTIIVT
jgi:hypothetical protein